MAVEQEQQLFLLQVKVVVSSFLRPMKQSQKYEIWYEKFKPLTFSYQLKCTGEFISEGFASTKDPLLFREEEVSKKMLDFAPGIENANYTIILAPKFYLYANTANMWTGNVVLTNLIG